MGNDTLVGGAGRDRFSLKVGSGIDTILDFTNFEDRMILINFVFEELLISPGTNGTLIRTRGNNETLAFLAGVAPNLINREDFSTLYIDPPPRTLQASAVLGGYT